MMARRMIVMLIAVGIVLGGIVGFQSFKAHIIKRVMASLANPSQTVSAIKADYQGWQPALSAVGTLTAEQGADLSLQLPGIVSAIAFKSGEDVQKGEVLLRLRDDEDAARLRALQATADLARITYERDRKLAPGRVISQATLDTDAANFENAEAQVATQRALLDQKVLRAPFSGHLGIREVDLGQYLPAGTTVVGLQALDNLFADFYLPQQDLARLRVGQPVTATIDAWPDRHYPGRIVAINPKVDPGSRNVLVRAELANPGHTLLPGMFARLSIGTGEEERRITLPATAIAYNSYGDSVFVVVSGPDHAKGQPQPIAEQRFVTLGPSRGDQVSVLKGVAAGDLVVTAGQMKLHNGSPVVINNKVQPSDSANPPLVDP
ncbi:MAG: efflux RND transporter periplasmic adaptor subunit [Acetobacteraceae bacterium]